MTKLFIILSFITFANICSAQQQDKISASLSHYFSFLTKTADDSTTESYNSLIDSVLWNAVQDETFMQQDLSTVKQLGDVSSPNGEIRIISWNILKKSGGYEYFGFLLTKPKKGGYSALRLHDVSAEYLEKPNNITFSTEKWYGSLYYEIIEVSHKQQTYYSLIGWRAKDLYVTEKVIEPLWFDKNGKAVFGADIFKYDNWPRKRMIFQYSAKTTMSLTYNKKHQKIVFDHLTPSQNIYGPYAQYYGPEGSYDSFEFKNGKWQVEFDIDARNPKKKKHSSKKK